MDGARKHYGVHQEVFCQQIATRMLIHSLATCLAELHQQLHGAAQGLEYIHRAGLVHGDLKGVGVFSF